MTRLVKASCCLDLDVWVRCERRGLLVLEIDVDHRRGCELVMMVDLVDLDRHLCFPTLDERPFGVCLSGLECLEMWDVEKIESVLRVLDSSSHRRGHRRLLGCLMDETDL